MKGIYAPDTLLRDDLAKVSTGAQAVFYAALYYSGVDYRPVWPSNAELMQRTGIKRLETLRGYKKELIAQKIIFVNSRFRNGEQTSNMIEFNFAAWEQIDAERGIKFVNKELEELVKAQVKKEIAPIRSRLGKVEKAVFKLNAFVEKYGITQQDTHGAKLYLLPREYEKNSMIKSELRQLASAAGVVCDIAAAG